MNCHEIYEIKRTWEIPAAAPTEFAVTILIRFLTKYPSNLEKFKAFKHLPLEELRNNARFKVHALRIIKVIDDSIEALGHDWAAPKLEQTWSNVAISHFERRIEKQSFIDLKGVILEVLKEVSNLNAKQTAVWMKLLNSVYAILFSKMDSLKKGEK